MKRIRIRIEAGILMTPDQLTGVGYYTDRLVRSLVKTHDVELFYGPFYRTRDPESFHDLPRLARRLVALSYRLYRKLDSHNIALPCDIFARQVDVTIFPANFSAWRTSRSKLSLVTLHDLTFLHIPESMEQKNLKHLTRVVPRAARKADGVIAVSETVKQELATTYSLDPEKILVTPVPPDSNTFFASPKLPGVNQKYGIPTEKYLLFIGTLEPRKNLPRLINAYCRLPDKIRQSHSLVLAGGRGWQTEAIDDAIDTANNSSTGSVVAIGRFDTKDSSALIQNASLLCIPSLYEGFGMPILEAMVCQTPVVASDIPVLRETGGDAAVYAGAKDTADLGNKLLQVLTSEQLRKDLQKKADRQLQKISWAKNADKLVAHTEKLLP